MLIEFQRLVEVEDEEGMSREEARPVSVNPQFVSAVLDVRTNPNLSIIRGPDGRGIIVNGSHAETVAKLSPAMN